MVNGGSRVQTMSIEHHVTSSHHNDHNKKNMIMIKVEGQYSSGSYLLFRGQEFILPLTSERITKQDIII